LKAEARLFNPAITRSAGVSFASRGQQNAEPARQTGLVKSAALRAASNAKRAGEAFPGATFKP
jgi:hypothetical protein